MYALSLNADYQPLKVISFDRAAWLVLSGKSYLAQGYEGRKLRSPSLTMEWTAVVSREVLWQSPWEFSRAVEQASTVMTSATALSIETAQKTAVRPLGRRSLPLLPVSSSSEIKPHSEAHRARILIEDATTEVRIEDLRPDLGILVVIDRVL